MHCALSVFKTFQLLLLYCKETPKGCSSWSIFAEDLSPQSARCLPAVFNAAVVKHEQGPQSPKPSHLLHSCCSCQRPPSWSSSSVDSSWSWSWSWSCQCQQPPCVIPQSTAGDPHLRLWSGVGPRLLKPLGADKGELATKNEESSAFFPAFVKLDWTEHLQISPPCSTRYFNGNEEILLEWMLKIQLWPYTSKPEN